MIISGHLKRTKRNLNLFELSKDKFFSKKPEKLKVWKYSILLKKNDNATSFAKNSSSK